MSRDSDSFGYYLPDVGFGSAIAFFQMFRRVRTDRPIMQSEVFFSGFSFEDFVVSERVCDAHNVWIPSIIGTRLVEHSIACT